MAEAEGLEAVEIGKVDMQWLQVLSEGWASPLTGFMREREFLQVRKKICSSSFFRRYTRFKGLRWPPDLMDLLESPAITNKLHCDVCNNCMHLNSKAARRRRIVYLKLNVIVTFNLPKYQVSLLIATKASRTGNKNKMGITNNGNVSRNPSCLQCQHFNCLLDDGVSNQSVPIVLAISAADKDRVAGAKAFALKYEGRLVAILRDPEVFPHKKEERAARTFGLTHEGHPYVKQIYAAGDWLVGGEIEALGR